MKILVFSDSHGCTRHMDIAIRDHLTLGRIDRIFFLGDGISDIQSIEEMFPSIPIDYVTGNCDDAYCTNFTRSNAIFEKSVTVGQVRFLLMHGHRYQVKASYQAAADHAIARKADILLIGHTHQKEDTVISGTNGGSVRLINPGFSNIHYGAGYACLDLVGRDVVCGFGEF